MRRARDRCWECDNCKELKKSRAEVLRRHPPFSGVKPPQEVLDFWQQERNRLPCLRAIGGDDMTISAADLMCFTPKEQKALLEILKHCAMPLEKIIGEVFDTPEEMAAFREKIERSL